MQGYVEARAQGLEPRMAAAHAGYESAGVAVTISRLEARADIQSAIRKLATGGKKGKVTAEEADEQWGMKDRYNAPLELMLDVMNNPKAPKGLRYQAAKDALPYCHARKEGGKKDEVKERAKAATKGRFQAQGRPSHMVVN